MSEPVSALNGAVADEGHYIRIEDRGPVGQVTLRGDLLSPGLQAAVGEVAGVAVPGIWGANLAADGRGAVWMSTDELLLLMPYGQAGAAVARLEEMLGAEHHMALDVSDARAVLRLTGASVAEVLMKGVPVDLSDRAFGVGLSRRSHLGGIAVGFWRREAEVWEIVCFQSFAQHLFDWLAASSVDGSQVDAA